MPADAKLVFVTRATYSGNLGGLTGADGLCAAAAASGSLPGSFQAWVSTASTTTTNAFDRIQGAGPWYLPGTDALGRRTKVFTSKAALRAAPLASIDRTELGQTIPGGLLVWTGTEATGNAVTPGVYDSSCLNWTDANTEKGNVGNVYGGDWSNAGTQYCGNLAALYCFQK